LTRLSSARGGPPRTRTRNLTLGDGAKERGALCHLIWEDAPGVGYLRMDGVAEPVRFGRISDQNIAQMAARWPAPPVSSLPPR
jgi:DNA segregation ATPase FtsK/SpoIIIE, S-DNA-T family